MFRRYIGSYAWTVSLAAFVVLATVWISYWMPVTIRGGIFQNQTTWPTLWLHPVWWGIHFRVTIPMDEPRPSWPTGDFRAYEKLRPQLPQEYYGHRAGFWIYWNASVHEGSGNATTTHIGQSYGVTVPAWFFLGITALLPMHAVWKSRKRLTRGFAVAVSQPRAE